MLSIAMENPRVEAKLVQQDKSRCIIAKFKTSTPPLTWQLDIEKNHSFTLLIQGDDDDCDLGITPLNGEFTAIAHFSSREDAEEAYVKIQKALFKQKSHFKHRLLNWVIYIFIAFLLFAFLSKGYQLHKEHNMDVSNAETSSLIENDRPEDPKIGVPLTADDVLTPPKE